MSISGGRHDEHLVRGGQAAAALVAGNHRDGFGAWLVEEFQAGLAKLSGARLPIAGLALRPDQTPVVALGGPVQQPLSARAQAEGLADFASLGPEGYLIRQVALAGRPTLLCGGNDDRGDLYAVYNLLEHLGLVFQLTGDVVPEARPDLPFPDLDLRCEPALCHRGLTYYDFCMPWAGLAEFRLLLDQMAKLRMNTLFFFSYAGAPWAQFAVGGEPVLLGDLYTRESGYRTLRLNTQTYTAAHMPLGGPEFGRHRVGSAEFQDCETPAQAHALAREMLNAVIDHAHRRCIEVWLGAGDCPGTPPNLGRHADQVIYWTTHCGLVIAPGDAVGLQVWEAAMRSLIDAYPEADRFMVGLAEWAVKADTPEVQALVGQYDHLRPLIPPVAQLKGMGYDYADPPFNYEDQALQDSDLVLLHYGNELIRRLTAAYPETRLGVYVLGRAYLFAALDAVLPKAVLLASMEASICWNRNARRIPMELFGVAGRKTVLVPRLDDGESGFGMQFNNALYANDQVLEGCVRHGGGGVMPVLGGRLRGVEHNAAYLAKGGWEPDLTPQGFYQDYAGRLFGAGALEPMYRAFQLLEGLEMFLGLEAESVTDAGLFLLGMGNFTDWTLSKDILHLDNFRRLRNPLAGPDSPEWDVRRPELPAWLRESAYRQQRYSEGLPRLEEALSLLEVARPLTAPGALAELDYLIRRTRLYLAHLQTILCLLDANLAYDRAFRARTGGQSAPFAAELERFAAGHRAALELARRTTGELAAGARCGTDQYLLFRYSVLWLRPLEAFASFVRNVVHFHRGLPYWEPVDWPALGLQRLPYENV
jgi:hypothetical protein